MNRQARASMTEGEVVEAAAGEARGSASRGGWWGSCVLVAVFAGVLLVPGVVTVGRWGERLPVGAMPRVSGENVLGFPSELRRYVDDNYGLRERLATWNAMARLEVFGTTVTPKVVLGKEGWLFYGAPEMLSSHRRTEPMTRERLERWAAAMEARQRACEARGSTLLVLVVPEKHTVYPEKMPDSLVQGDGPSRLDQFVAYLGEHTRVRVVDLRAGMSEAKAKEMDGTLLYQRYDTHWTDVGAAVGYRGLLGAMSNARPEYAAFLVPRGEGEVERRKVWVGWRDLSRMMALGGQKLEEMVVLVPRRQPPELKQVGPFGREAVVPEAEREGAPDLFVFHASFSDRLMPMLTPHFSRSGFRLLRGFDFEELGQGGRKWPAFVVTEFAERNLAFDPPEDNLPAEPDVPGGMPAGPG